ncbi:hypothetical protein JCM24511_07558 [Saitozyma sp. JCM 24511]|nr:hypothetical protein JCM24511_07558 [Saitozyma sp. JCM 24511]
MTAPAADLFSALMATTGLFFCFWHMWHYDRFRCLVATRNDWFRALMCYILLASVASLFSFTWIEVKVSYAEYYVSIEGETIVAPWQLWTQHHQRLWRISIYILTIGWTFLQSIHLEEFLYWGYLISSLRSIGGPKTSWLRSPYFRFWVLASLAQIALLFGAVSIETTNLNMMRAYVFMVGSPISCLLALASFYLVLIFPSFIATSRRQGAAPEVLERLHFFAEMNQIRTVFRFIYAAAFLILAADAVTPEQRINKNSFASDCIFLCGQFGIFTSTCLSVIVLLPRNMTSESLPVQGADLHPFSAYKRPAPPGSRRHFHELGDRLNVERDALGALVEDIELSPDLDKGSSRHNSPTPDPEAPFVDAADKAKRARYSEFPILPSVVQKFKSPFEINTSREGRRSGPTQVFVTTSQTVHREE